MAVLIILRGNSGSGKTSVAKKLQEKLGAEMMLISQDVVRREMLHTKDVPHSHTIPFIIHLLEYAHQHENYVILEGILNATWYRPVFQFVKELFGDAIFAYYYDLPFEETLKRHQTRSQSQEFGAEKMARWWKDSDISDVLNEKIFRAEISLQQALISFCQISKLMESRDNYVRRKLSTMFDKVRRNHSNLLFRTIEKISKQTK